MFFFMEGVYGKKARLMRKRYFEKQQQGYQISFSSLRSEMSNLSMVSDSESSDSESDSYEGPSFCKKADIEHKRSNTRTLHDDFYPNRSSTSPVKRKLFSEPMKKAFFGNDSKQRAKQWGIIVTHWYDDDDDILKDLHQRVNDLLACSIPKEMRSKIWCLFASSYDLLRKSEGIYDLCLHSRHNQYNEAIWSDVRRTLPEHPSFSDPKGEGQQSLFNILRAYSSFNPAVGYVQCMNFIVGYLQSQIKNAELTFWTFVSMMQSLKGLFTEGLPLLKRSMDIFDAVIRQHLPVLYAHFAKQKFNISPIVSRWCSTLFCCAELPFKFSIHVLDIYLYKGYDFIFKVGTCLLSEGQGTLLKLGGDEIQQCLQSPSFVNNSQIIAKARKLQFNEEIQNQIDGLRIN